MTLVDKREQIWQSLNDTEYRHQFVEEEINVGIAFQIRSLRNRQKLTQGKLADLLGVKQPLVSSWENPNYGRYSLGTLKDLARAFDVGLVVRFVPFGLLTDWTVNLTPDIIAPPSFKDEQSQNALMAYLKQVGTDANQAYSSTTGIDANLARAPEERIPAYA
jgi:transcriptional regulator with XRE-family HTH domain